MKPKEKEILEELAILREVTRNTGALHEIQVKHLKLYSVIISDKITKTEIKYNFAKKEIIFELMLKSKIKQDSEKRFQSLSQWTQDLLGTEYKIFIVIKNKIVFTGKRLKSISNKDEWTNKLKEDFEEDK